MNISGLYGKTIGGVLALGALSYFGGSALKEKFEQDVSKKTKVIKNNIRKEAAKKEVAPVVPVEPVKIVPPENPVQQMQQIAKMEADKPQVVEQVVEPVAEPVAEPVVEQVVEEQVVGDTSVIEDTAVVEAINNKTDVVKEQVLIEETVPDPTPADVTPTSKQNNKQVQKHTNNSSNKR